MNDLSEYLTIKEVAERVGKTPQAIYKALNQVDNQLNNFLKIVESKKYLHISILKEFEQESFKPVEQPVQQPVDNQLNESLIKTIDLLSKQLDQKDKQISDINERLKEAQELNKNQQILLLQEQEKSPKRLNNHKQERADPEEQPIKNKWFSRFKNK